MQLKYPQFTLTYYLHLCPDSVAAYHLALSENLRIDFAKRPGPGFKFFTSHDLSLVTLKTESPGQGVIKNIVQTGPVAQLGRAPAF